MGTTPVKVAFLFPGQGSQAVGMGMELAEVYPVAMETFQEADQILGFSISHVAWRGPEEELNDTINTQPALMVHSIAALRVLQKLRPDLIPIFVAGHSMGELTALVAAGALPFSDGLKLVRTRGELMKAAGEASPGGMAAILGLDLLTVEEICIKASSLLEPVQVANDNCPGQVVISGSFPAIERALNLANSSGARRAVKLSVSIAAHSSLMAKAQAGFNKAVSAAPLTNPYIPIIGNVQAKPLSTIDHIRTDLQAQLNSRVRWTESIQYLINNGITTFVEIGNETVLAGLMKRIDRSARVISISNPADFKKVDVPVKN